MKKFKLKRFIRYSIWNLILVSIKVANNNLAKNSTKYLIEASIHNPVWYSLRALISDDLLKKSEKNDE